MSNPVESGAAAAEMIRAVGQWLVPALGAGTWALGGPWEFAGAPAGWGEVEAGMPRWQQRLAEVREELCTGGRTLVQGALAYVWARSHRAVALGGIRTPAQAREQAGALAHGPLTSAQVARIDALAAAA
jgi:hypothetical protein